MRKVVCFAIVAAMTGLAVLLSGASSDSSDQSAVAARYYLRNRTAKHFRRSYPRRVHRYQPAPSISKSSPIITRKTSRPIRVSPRR